MVSDQGNNISTTLSVILAMGAELTGYEGRQRRERNPKKGYPIWSEEQKDLHFWPKSLILQLMSIIRGKDPLPKGSQR